MAYEIVINSDPRISYYMEENTMAMQDAGARARGAFGHNHFFKNNYVFQQWTDPSSILDYLDFAKRYVLECEERHGVSAVEKTLDAAHALMNQGVFRYFRRATKLKLGESEEGMPGAIRVEDEARNYSDLWRTVPSSPTCAREVDLSLSAEVRARKQRLRLPEENLLYFLEKNSPILHDWQRELLRIVRNIAQYFYPQRQTKLMNEGCATFVHYHIVNQLYEKGLISEGALLEILHSHSNVVYQADYDDPRYNGVNPYALGFAMMQDIQRICVAPTAEDHEWFPDLAGRADWRGALKDIWANFRDRILRAAVPEPTPHPAVQTVRAVRQGRRVPLSRRRDPRRRGLSPCARDSRRELRHRLQRAGHPDRRRRSSRQSGARPSAQCAKWREARRRDPR